MGILGFDFLEFLIKVLYKCVKYMLGKGKEL